MKRLVLCLVLFIGACSSDTAPLTISDVVIRKPVPGMQMSAGYFNMTNHTSETVVITTVTSPQFDSVEMHETVIEDSVARMRGLGDLVLAPGSSVEFQPGGKHLMLMRPIEDLTSVTLDFHAGDDVVLSINVAVTD
jgi:copper(I)-binding protein